MNSVNIIGRLTKDPEITRTETGHTICDLRLAMSDYRSKEDRTDFITVTAFGNLANLCESYLRKGFMTGIDGHIRSDAYTDKDGVKRYPIKVIAENVQFLQWPEKGEGEAALKEAV